MEFYKGCNWKIWGLGLFIVNYPNVKEVWAQIGPCVFSLAYPKDGVKLS